MPKQRDLARDTSTGREGEVMAEPEHGTKYFWLRPVGGGREWPVLPEYIEIIERAEQPTAADV